jgi:hypothetical protein
LKTKDYLGKARLVAASDRSNAFTGFTGSEMKKGSQVAKDDRPEEKLSFAATNLVKPELQSRVRQQSEPPMNRNMFPPTPPPESDGGRKSNGSGGSSDAPMSRAQSVRGGGPKPQPLNLGRAAFEQQQPQEPRRQGTQRSASERPPPNRSESTRNRQQRDNKPQPRRRGSDDDIIDDYYEEDDYRQPARGSRNANTRSKQRRPAYIEEEDEDDYDGSDLDDAEFEMMPRSKSRKRSPARSTRSGGSNRAPVGGKIRVKVHAGDTRYVFINQDTTMREFWQQIKEKFGVRNNFKVEIKDDGDMITMADQDDLDMAIESARSMARRDNSDMAKLEVSQSRVYFNTQQSNTNKHHRFGLEKYRLEIPQHLHMLRQHFFTGGILKSSTALRFFPSTLKHLRGALTDFGSLCVVHLHST